MTNNGKNDMTKRQNYRYNYLLANTDRLRLLSFLKTGPQKWMDAFEKLDFEGKGNFAHLLDGMEDDLLIRRVYDTRLGVTQLEATEFGLEKLRQTKEEISKL